MTFEALEMREWQPAQHMPAFYWCALANSGPKVRAGVSAAIECVVDTIWWGTHNRGRTAGVASTKPGGNPGFIKGRSGA